MPAGRGRQLSSLARLAIVVGIPFASAFLRVPLWFTLLLLLGLAGFLFVGPHLSQRSPSDPKQAWMRLMASFIKLQSTYCDLKESPANAAALEQFSTLEEKCLSILSSRADCGWGPDSQYAVKIRNEIAAMSAQVRAGGGNPAPTPEQQTETPAKAGQQVSTSARPVAAVQPGNPAPPAKPEVPEMVGLILETDGMALHHDASPSPSVRPDAPTPAEQRGLAPAGAVKVLQPCSPALSARPEVSIPAEKQSLSPLSQSTALQPAGPILQATPKVPTSEGLLDLILASEGAAPRLDCPMSPARPDAPTPTEEEGLTLAGVGAAVQPDESPRASAKAEVTTPVKEQVLALVSGREAVQPDSPAPAYTVEGRAPALEYVLTSESVATALHSDISAPPARDEAATREEKQILMLAYAGTASQAESPEIEPDSWVWPS
jgi:hypothetical protein